MSAVVRRFCMQVSAADRETSLCSVRFGIKNLDLYRGTIRMTRVADFM